MKIEVAVGDIAAREDAAVEVNLFEGVTHPGGATGAMDSALGGAISDLIADGDIKAGRGEHALIHSLGKTPAKRVVVSGLGSAADFDANAAREIHAGTARFIRSRGLAGYSTILHGAGIGGLDVYACARAAAEGILLGAYSFDKYKSDPKPPLAVATIVEFDAARIPEIERGVADGTIVADAVNLARDMCNEPANHMTPTQMAEIALAAAGETGMSLTVFDRADIERMGMGAFAGVAQGTDEPPKLIVLRYEGDPDDPANNLGLLGKGITFDSGGLDIKSASGMLTMKSDMSGGASVIAAMKAIAALAPKINVWGIVPATENMPGRRAQRPGDVVRAMNGKTIEIGNTDAEGRLVLADAVCYAVQNGLTRLVDVATLTGAVRIALGDAASGAFGNDRRWVERVIAAGESVGEPMWHLPDGDSYKHQYKSDIADINNVGGSGAGATIGALVIGEFAGESQWAHLDIAATARTTRDAGINPKGATGVPVRTLIQLAQTLGGG